MVRNGLFTVELVDAEIKFPFSEETVHGTTLHVLMAEQGDEYFIRVTSFYKDPVVCSISVDGKSLGYYVTLGKEPATCGVWSFKGGQSTDRALKFASKSCATPGRVQVDFYKGVFRGYKERTDHLSSSEGGAQSHQGNRTETQIKKGARKKKYDKGQEMGSIVLDYQTIG